MKKLLFLYFIAFAFSVFAQTKNIVSSEIRWKAYKTLKAESLSHFGTVKLKSGNLVFSNGEVSGGSFVIDMNTMDAEDLNGDTKLKKMFENHLKSDDFFDVTKFPVSTFNIKSVKKLKSNSYNYQIHGVLMIKGISKNISFPVKASESNGLFTLSSAKFTFNRKDFGLKYNIFEDMLISNEVEMNVNVAVK